MAGNRPLAEPDGVDVPPNPCAVAQGVMNPPADRVHDRDEPSGPAIWAPRAGKCFAARPAPDIQPTWSNGKEDGAPGATARPTTARSPRPPRLRRRHARPPPRPTARAA